MNLTKTLILLLRENNSMHLFKTLSKNQLLSGNNSLNLQCPRHLYCMNQLLK